MQEQHDAVIGQRRPWGFTRRAYFLGFAGVVLCAGVVPQADATASRDVPARHTQEGFVPSRVMLMMMLESLALTLADDLERPAGSAASEQDALAEAAELLVLGYAIFGVDESLDPEEASEAAATTVDVQFVVIGEGGAGLDPELAADLSATLEAMHVDLEHLAP